MTVKNFLTVLLSTLILLLILEGVFRLIGAPGARRFIEQIVLTEKLSRFKAADEFRIFAFGESTLVGDKYAPVSSPVRWLEAYLKDYLPGRKIKLVNFSRMGFGSFFAYRAFLRTLVYQPDLVIFYLGHNTYLPGSRKEDIEKEENKLGGRLSRLSRESYLISTVSRWVLVWQMKRRERRKEEDSMEYKTIEVRPNRSQPTFVVPRHSPKYWENLEFFKSNLRKILDLGNQEKIPVLFMKPVSNLKDFSPWESVHTKELSAEALSLWETFYGEGKKLQEAGRLEEALSAYLKAHPIDPTYADLSFRLGQIYFQQNEMEKAKHFFEEARDYDAIIIRANEDTLKVLEELSREYQVPIFDTEAVLAPLAPGRILGHPVIEDNVHFSVEGHALVGRGLAHEISNQGWIAPHEEWQFERGRSFEEIAAEFGIDDSFIASSQMKMIHYFGSRFKERLQVAEMAYRRDPVNPKALRHLAWTYWLREEEGEAVAVYKKLLRIDRKGLLEVFRTEPDLRTAFVKSRLSGSAF